MGIYIPDMTIPQSDNEEIIIHSDGIAIKYRCGYGKLIKMMKTVVEIPDHGRLIDADELRANHGLGEICKNCPVDKRYCQYEMIYTKMEVCGWIDDADTIIPASNSEK